jgi:hypothetical protein
VRQEKELTKLARELRRGTVEPMVLSLAIGTKERRTTRLEQKRRHASNDPALPSGVPPFVSNSPEINVA